MANLDEIREKYQYDKRQTGQNFVTNWGSGASFSSGVGQRPNMSQKGKEDFKRFARGANKPGEDPLLKSKGTREKRALELKLENKTKQVKALIEEMNKIRRELEDKYKIVAFPYTEIKGMVK